MTWDSKAGFGTMDSVLDAAECAEHVDRAERAGFTAAPIISGYREVFASEVRNTPA